MKNNRREVLKVGMLGAVAAATGVPVTSLAGERSTKPAGALDILVLGGTGFIGPHMVREALARGHGVTLFNRGRTNSGLFPDLETIKGDRAGDLQGLANRRWNAAIDNSGYMPQYVQNSARTLAENIDQYLFISSISAYASFAEANHEGSPLAVLEDEGAEFSWENYGALKVLCEKRVSEELGKNRTTILRPTYICGPGDTTDRFTYWPVRAQHGGRMLWPGSPAHTMQIIDVRDLATFVIDCLEAKTAGVYNTVTPVNSYTMGDLLQDCQEITSTTVEPVWVDDAFVEKNQANQGGELPIWHPQSGEYAHASSVSGERARKAGLRNRPVRETIRDLMTWWDTLPEERVASAKFGMTAEKEAELIAAWDDSRG